MNAPENQKKDTEVNIDTPPAHPGATTSGLAFETAAGLRLPLFLGIAVAIVLLDQTTKWIIVSRLGLYESIPIIQKILSLTRIHNSGIAFGLFPGRPNLFTGVTCISMLVVFYFYLTAAAGRFLSSLACALILGGAAGNLMDRFRLGYVVDFINFSFWPTFNVADSAVSIGVALLLVSFILDEKGAAENASDSV